MLAINSNRGKVFWGPRKAAIEELFVEMFSAGPRYTETEGLLEESAFYARTYLKYSISV
jgi:hypothetical protein